jgi:uncharacterized protein
MTRFTRPTRWALSSVCTVLALAAGAVSTAWAQTAAPAAAPAAAAAPVSKAKKALVDKLLKLQQPGIELMGRTMAEQPAQQLVMGARNAMNRVPEGKREGLVRELDADLKKYLDEAVPIVSSRAVALAPGILGPMLEQGFTEAELKEIIGILESPVNAKYQRMAGEMQRALGAKLIAETRSSVEPKVKALEQSVTGRLRSALPAASSPGN